MVRLFALLAIGMLVAACAATQEGLAIPDAKVVPDATPGTPDAGPADAKVVPDAPIPDAALPDAKPDAQPDATPAPDACVPTSLTELCNSLDDNCNGQVDEGFAKGGPCTVGMGICAKTGQFVCSQSGLTTECNVKAGPPSVEQCGNALDDDCDGMTDEGFEDLNKVCTNGTGACQTTGIWQCSQDRLGLTCSAVPGNPSTELCGNNIDDDCDGLKDEGFEMLGLQCNVGVGACARTGVWVCTPDRLGIQCSVSPGNPTNESCNGMDDDCDGQIDEDFVMKGLPCDGDDEDLCQEGHYVCRNDGSDVECDDHTGDNVEICNGIDDDCNPATPDGSDEPTIKITTPCTTGDDACNEGFIYCNGAAGLACSDPGDDNTTNDPNNCGACGNVCQNPHGTRSCGGSNCTPGCDFGWQTCGDPKAGCLSHRDTNATCPGDNLGTIEGDGDEGGSGNDNNFNIVDYAERQVFYRVDDVGTCTHESIGVQITFKNPPNVRFGICARCFDCAPKGGPERCYEPGAGSNVTFKMGAFDNCGFSADDTHWQVLRVYYISGDNASCGNWTLDIVGDQENLSGSEETCGGDT